MTRFKKISGFTILALGLFVVSSFALGASPTTNNWFQLLVNPYTGADNTGDGGTGNPSDYNYFYVGQTFSANIQIKSSTTSASNIWIDYDPVLLTASNLLTGTYFSSWSGQTINSGRIKSTGFNISGYSSGLSGAAGFGSVDFTALKPTETNYGTVSSTTLIINTGTIGSTTDSNISYQGDDLLQEVENFNLHIWADTKAPYAINPSPTNGATGVSVDSNFTFDLHDSKNGTGDNTGVGTGVNTAMTANSILVSDQSATSSYSSYTSFACSGTWGTNLCTTNISPLPPSGIPSDNRLWDYDTLYTIQVSGFRDYASTNQDQLGDPNGPNYMATSTYNFTTEADTNKPVATNKVPAESATNININSDISFDIVDKKSSNVSGAGVNASSCLITISSPSFASTTYQQGSLDLIITPTNYGFHFVINPATPFNQNETVTVNIHDCQDLASTPNVMVTDIYTFITADTSLPTVDTTVPANDQLMSKSDPLTFHLKDSGVGIDLTKTIIYLNGIYYTLSGGAGSVTNTGTKINFTSSLKFAGGNYGGDITSYSCTSSDKDCAFILKPSGDFTPGESVPVIIYSQDNAGNLMERVVYAPVVEGGSCFISGSSYCGTNTTWDAVSGKCVGSGGGTTGNCGSSGTGRTSSTLLIINPNSITATQVNGSTILITWYSNLPSTSRVIYDTVSQNSPKDSPSYNYHHTTEEINTNSTYHAVQITGLVAGQTYYFRPISRTSSGENYGPEVVMAPKFTTTISPIRMPATEKTCPQVICPSCPGKILIVGTTSSTSSIIYRTLTNKYSPLFFWLAFIALAAIVGASLSLLFLIGRPIGITKRFFALILSLITISAIILMILIIGDKNLLKWPLAQNQGFATISLSGRVINPLNLQGVANVDLVNGHTALRTSSSGQYIFDQVPVASGIRMTAPALNRTLIILPPKGSTGTNFNIYFNQDLFNTLIKIIDLESRKQLADVYNYLPTNVKTKISSTDFEKKTTTIFNTENTSDQEIKIKTIHLLDKWTAENYDLSFSKIIQIAVSANGQDGQYQFINEKGNWELIK